MRWAAERPQRRGKTQAGRLADESDPVMRTQVGRPGDPATRRPGDPATRRPGDPATRRPGDPATRRPGDPATRRPGDPAYCNNRIVRVCQVLARVRFGQPAVQAQLLREHVTRRAQRIPHIVKHGHRVAPESVARHVAQQCAPPPGVAYPAFAHPMPSSAGTQSDDARWRHGAALAAADDETTGGRAAGAFGTASGSIAEPGAGPSRHRPRQTRRRWSRMACRTPCLSRRPGHRPPLPMLTTDERGAARRNPSPRVFGKLPFKRHSG